MNTSYPTLGIDVSKHELELATHGQPRTHRFANDPDGIAALVQHLAPRTPERVVLEATGGYERALTHALTVAARGRNALRDHFPGFV